MFPSVIKHAHRGKARLCKQCGRGFVVSKASSDTQALMARSNADLVDLAKALAVKHGSSAFRRSNTCLMGN
jgi:hypothetical protein